MSNVWTEGFEVTRSQAGIAREYENVTGSAFSFVTGSLQGFALRCGTLGTTAIIRTPPYATHATQVIGFRIKQTGTSQTVDLVKFQDGTANVNCKLVLTSGASTFTIALVVGSTTIATSSAMVIGAWYYLEFKVLLATGATGTYSFRINETVDFSGSSTVTAAVSATADRVQLQLASPTDLDDWYINTGAGSAHNDFEGDQVIEGLLPLSDVLVSGTGVFPAAPSTHFDKVDDPATTQPDDAATYVFSSADGQKDVYGFGSLAYITGNIQVVKLLLTVALASSGTRNIKPKYRNTAGTEANAAAQAVGSTAYFPSKRQIWEKQPVANAAWTVADINNAGGGGNGFGFETGS